MINTKNNKEQVDPKNLWYTFLATAGIDETLLDQQLIRYKLKTYPQMLDVYSIQTLAVMDLSDLCRPRFPRQYKETRDLINSWTQAIRQSLNIQLFTGKAQFMYSGRGRIGLLRELDFLRVNYWGYLHEQGIYYSEFQPPAHKFIQEQWHDSCLPLSTLKALLKKKNLAQCSGIIYFLISEALQNFTQLRSNLALCETLLDSRKKSPPPESNFSI